MNQMHLYEFLSCVATAVDDPAVRANFVGNVLSSPMETLESAEVQQQISSEQSLLRAFGVLQAGEDPSSVNDWNTVKQITANYNRLFMALNRLLSVGKRCSEAARKQGGGLTGIRADSSTMAVPGMHNFPDEGPLSTQTLALTDPFAPLWIRILPYILKIYEATLGVWRPENQSVLLRHQYQKYVYAISDDEAFLSKNHSKTSGGVFGEGGTAGSVVSGVDRRDNNLLPRWSGWFNELRNTCFQLISVMVAERVVFAPELSALFPRFVAVLTHPQLLRSMEHRHLTQYLKHITEIMMVCCPSTLYATHLAPVLHPVMEHVRYRLEMAWSPIIRSSAGTSEATKALTSTQAVSAADLASRGGEEWYKWYYAHSGLFVGDLDGVTAEAAVEKHRVDLSRTYSDILQVALALKGPWALVLANLAKDEQASKRNDNSKSTMGPRNQINDDIGALVNADGSLKLVHQKAIDARKLARINGICQFMLLENQSIAWNLISSVVQCLGYPDAYTVRRITKVCHRILETVAWSPQYTQIIGEQMFNQAIRNVVTEPKWMVGIEWDMINVLRDIYCRLVLGQTLLFGGQGPGVQMNSLGENSHHYEQAKTIDRPLQGGGVLTAANDTPRRTLAEIPGIGVAMVENLERDLKTKRAAKDQKDTFRDLLRVASDNVRDMIPSDSPGEEGGIFSRAIEAESLLHTGQWQPTIPSLPEKRVTRSQLEKAKQKSWHEQQGQQSQHPKGLSAFSL